MNQKIAALIRPWLDQEHEYAFLVLADDRGPNLAARVGIGDKHRVSVPLDLFLRPALIVPHSELYLVHSHATGHLFVSDNDMSLTRSILAATTACGLTLTDHLIIAPDGRALSMVAAHKLAPLPAVTPKAADHG